MDPPNSSPFLFSNRKRYGATQDQLMPKAKIHTQPNNDEHNGCYQYI